MTDGSSGTTRRTSLRRNKITRYDSVAIVCVGVLAGIAAALSKQHPTGWAASDAALTFAFVVFVVWSAASAPWWALAVAATAAGVASHSIVWVVVAAAALVVSLVIGAQRLNQPVFRAAAAGLTMQSLLHLRIGTFAVSAVVTASVTALLVGVGVARRNRFIRRRVRIGATVAAAFVGVAIIGVVIGALQARGHLERGERALKDGANAVRSGDSAGASTLFSTAAGEFGAASQELRRPWAVLGLATPVLGQHMRVLDDLTSSAHTVAGSVATQIQQVRLDDLKLSGGVVNVAAVQALAGPLQQTHDSLAGFSLTLRSSRSPWLVSAVTSRLASIDEQVDRLVQQTARASDAVSVAPNMLGANGVRTYFVGFTNPAEARGLGGFLGNWAELQVIDGKISVVRSGRTKELFAAGPPPVLSQSPEFFARYGRFGAGAPGQPTSIDYWSNITMSPDLPTVAGVIADLYPRSGGSKIDGVIMIDPYGLAGLLQLTGPVTVPGVAKPIDAANVAQFLMRDQYASFDDSEPDRAEALQRVTEAATLTLLGGDLPGARVIGDALAPAVRDGHLSIWSLDPADQPALGALGVSSALPAPTGDGLGVVTNNSGGNKLDAYLKRTVTYTGTVDAASGVVDTTATVSLTNDTPADVTSLPDYVAGNAEHLPKGTNRTYVSLYSLLPLVAATQDGTALGTEAEREKGWSVYSLYVDIPPGSTVHLAFHLRGSYEPKSGYRLTLFPQSLANPQPTSVHITDGSDDVTASFQGVLQETETIGIPAESGR